MPLNCTLKHGQSRKLYIFPHNKINENKKQNKQKNKVLLDRAKQVSVSKSTWEATYKSV